MLSVFRCATPITCTRTAVALWVLAVGLLAVDTYLSGNEPTTALARWSLLVGIAAGSATVAAVVNQARRVVLEVASWEHRLTRAEVAPHEVNPNVIPLARRG